MPLDQVVDEELERPGEKEMTFLEHLEELRWHIIRSLVAVVSAGIILFIFKGPVFAVINGPRDKDFITYRVFCKIAEWTGVSTVCFEPPVFQTQAIGFAEAFIMHIKISFIMGLILAFPYVFYQVWTFVKPGLYEKEQNVTRRIVAICSILFLLGVLFGYYIISPFAIKWLAGYEIPGVENIPTLSSYINYMIMFTAPAGLIFELPIVVFFLSKLGLVTPELMRQYRRHSIIGILLLAAIVTPPDVVTQFLIAIPLYFLYEASIYISRKVQKDLEKAEAAEAAS